ncbi:hypothetical protein ASE85_09335 [Sphingobium sp. Leaf26]|uniref:hypothetical protein n=1 Tax=Sphingobium sp. Leaf26 TaxID=1735693 RepID=UPI000712C72D|nr:hypothetical protein [Sphingobium sp. Leaf26]KQN00819.1 hypothetical protein ASE85_09335 [Sphingobium sp. Leaf26]
MIPYILHRYAFLIALAIGLIVPPLVLSDDAKWWVKFGVMLPFTLLIYWLLYKDGITENRSPGHKPPWRQWD